jgi:hypothetical protein
MNFQVGRGHVGFHLSTAHPQMSRDLRRMYKQRFPYCKLVRIHRDCFLLVVGQVILVYIQWGNGLA